MKKTPILIARSLLFSILFGIFPLMALWKYNLGEVSAGFVMKPLLITLLVVLVIFGICLLLTRSWEKAAIFSGVMTVFIFLFGHLYNLLAGKTVFGISLGFVKLFVIYLLFFIAVIILLSRVRKIPESLFLPLNLIAFFLVIINLVPILTFEIKLASNNTKPSPASEVVASDSTNLPDIYYIVLDAYARDDVLRDVIGYDNSAFLQALKDRGFYIPECAFSNYHTTMFTLPSVLNYQYLQDLTESADPEGGTTENIKLFKDNKARIYFQNLGYKIVTGRGFTSYMDINDSDLYLNYFEDKAGADDYEQHKFTSLYLNTTIYRVLTEMYKNNPENFSWMPYWLAVDRTLDPNLESASFWYYQNLYMFDSMQQLPQKPGHYFVFAHIISPHEPYVYRKDGTFRYPLDTQDVKVLYADQVTYLNKRVLELVDALQKDSDVQPIIIIQADHSIHKLTSGLDKHKILSAYYLPGRLNTPPYATITPVNDFRLIIRNYFDPTMELLPDTLYVKWSDNDLPVASSCDLKPH